MSFLLLIGLNSFIQLVVVRHHLLYIESLYLYCAGFARIAGESDKSHAPIRWVLPPGISAKALSAVFKLDWINRYLRNIYLLCNARNWVLSAFHNIVYCTALVGQEADFGKKCATYFCYVRIHTIVKHF